MSRKEEQELQRERDLRAVDPRVGRSQYTPRMRMLNDERSLAERGTRLSGFIDPDIEPKRCRGLNRFR